MISDIRIFHICPILSKLAEKTEDKAYTILEKYTGKELEYKEYEPLFPYATPIITIPFYQDLVKS